MCRGGRGTRTDPEPKGFGSSKRKWGGIWRQEKIRSQEGIWNRSCGTGMDPEPEVGAQGRNRTQIPELGGGGEKRDGFDSEPPVEPVRDVKVEL